MRKYLHDFLQRRKGNKVSQEHVALLQRLRNPERIVARHSILAPRHNKSPTLISAKFLPA
jgi:hypothetical protein